ncbi:tyrosine-type recombinase/integrase [Pseudomonas sp. NA-150]|uniref:tyrosine-type recombinase/integrase n=1 Tax=Pseudomonas sp. NA-150 TaxID=3367525 RepID=UPI0037C7B875
MYLISELLGEYLSDKVLKGTSQRSYSVACRALIRQAGDCLVEQVDRKTILQWRKDALGISLKPVSWNSYVRHLRGLLQFGIDRGLVGLVDNPFAGCHVRPTRRPCKTVEQKNVARARHLLTDMEQEEIEWGQQAVLHPAWFWRVVFETFAYTGLRANELICLRMCDIDLHKWLICVTADVSKNYEERKVPIHNSLHEHLVKLVRIAKKRKIRDDQQLFNVNMFSMRHRKEFMDMDQVSAFYKRLSKLLGQRLSAHRFRHTIATELMRFPDRNIHTVKELLGHRNIATTMKYITVDHRQMRELLNSFA